MRNNIQNPHTQATLYLNAKTKSRILNGVQGADIPSSKVQSAAAV